jgi:hypothetical protein
MMERILSELQNRRGSQPGLAGPAMGDYPNPALSNYPDMMSGTVAIRTRAVSLSDLKKQRIDVEDELEKLQGRLAKIDEQISKLQGTHPAKESRFEQPQAK